MHISEDSIFLVLILYQDNGWWPSLNLYFSWYQIGLNDAARMSKVDPYRCLGDEQIAFMHFGERPSSLCGKTLQKRWLGQNDELAKVANKNETMLNSTWLQKTG